MLCHSHLAVLSILLLAASSTPFVPRDNDGQQLYDHVVEEHMEAAPRQVYTGHHGPADDQALTTTEAPSMPSSIYTPDNNNNNNNGKGRAGFHQLRARQDDTTISSSSTILCPLPPQTVKVTVISTATMIMNVATLWPKPLTPRALYTGAGAADAAEATDDEAPPIPTAELLLHLGGRDAEGEAAWMMPAPEGVIDNDVLQGGDQLPYNPGGVIIKATPPLVPALETVASTAATSALATDGPSTPSSSSSGAAAATAGISISGSVFVSVALPVPTAGACTTTMLGNMAQPCRAAGALTVYTSTTTYYKAVDCGGCASLHVIQPKWGCPYMSVQEEETVDYAYTWTTFLCSGAATPGAAGSATALAASAASTSLASLATPAALSSVTGVATESTPAAAVVATSSV